MGKDPTLKTITIPSGTRFQLCDTRARTELRIVEIVCGVLFAALFVLVLVLR